MAHSASSVSDAYVMSWLVFWLGMPFRVLLRVMQWFQSGRGRGNLAGVNAPVDTERFTTELHTKGEIPAGLNGVFLRTGPNIQHPPQGGYHLFDGDAMLHAVYFKDGKAKSYHNHWLRTPKFLHERAFGAPLHSKIGDVRGLLGVAVAILEGLFSWIMYPFNPKKDGSYGAGPLGNTALVFHRNKILALMESGFPFAVKFCKGLIESLGILTYGGQLKRAMTAHPKRHPVTGDLHAFHYKPDGARKEWCNYYVCAADGAVSRTVNIDVSRPQMMHDFAITRNYAVFLDNALVFDLGHVARGGAVPFTSDSRNPCRIGIVRKPADVGADALESTGLGSAKLNRSADNGSANGRANGHAQGATNGKVSTNNGKASTSANGKVATGEQGVVQWFEVPPFVCIHTINAWEVDDGTICVAFCQGDSLNLDSAKAGDYYANGPYPYRYTLHLFNGAVEKECLTPQEWAYRCEFPVVAGAAYGHKQKYTYLVSYHDDPGNSDGGIDDFDGIVKLDVTAPAGKGWVSNIKLRGHAIGEPFFVPRDAEAMQRGVAHDPYYATDTDDGWLLAWTVEKASGKCQCMIWDAATMANEPIAVVTIPVRVPTGFHSLFVPQRELDAQDPKLRAPVWDPPSHSSGSKGRQRGTQSSSGYKGVAGSSEGQSSGVGGESEDVAAYRRRLLTGSAQ